jgi:hypothetical protein
MYNCHVSLECGDDFLEFPWILHVHLHEITFIFSSINVNSLWNWPNWIEQTLWVDSNMQQNTWMIYVGLFLGIQTYFWTHIIPRWMTTLSSYIHLTSCRLNHKSLNMMPTFQVEALTPTLRTCISIDWNNNLVQLWKNDKRRKLPFSYVQFIKFHLNKPIIQSYKVSIFQCFMIFIWIQQCWKCFFEIMILISALYFNGFDVVQFLHIIHKYIMDIFPLVKFNVEPLCNRLQGMSFRIQFARTQVYFLQITHMT